MANVFVSYAREDLAFAEKIATRLNRMGLTVWWDRRLLAGDSIEAAIDEQIHTCDAVVVIWSLTSLESHWVKSEAAAALALNKFVPVRMEDCRLPRPYDQIHTLDLSDWNGGFNEDIRLLFDSIQTITRGKKVKRGPGKPVKKISKRRIFSIGALASAAVVGLAVVSDLTDLVGNLKGSDSEQILNEKLEQLDERLASLDGGKTSFSAPIDEIYLRESLRALQMLDIPVDDIVIQMADTPSFDDVVSSIEATLASEDSTLNADRKRHLLHQLAALLYHTDRNKAESLYETILDSNPNDFAANLLMSDIYANKNDPKSAAKFVTAAYQVPAPNKSSEYRLEILHAFNVGLEQDYQEAADLLEDIQTRAKLEGLSYQRSSAIHILSMLLVILDRRDEARQLLTEIIEVQRDNRFYSHLAGCLFTLAEIEIHENNSEAASVHLDEFLTISQALQKPGYLAQGYELFGRLELESGNLVAAETHFSQGLAISREHKHSGNIIRNAIGMANVNLARDDIPSACRFFNVAETETLIVGSRSFTAIADKKQNLCGPL